MSPQRYKTSSRLSTLLLLVILLASSFVALAARKPNFSNKNDYYAILGLPQKATNKDIKSAYRKLALKYHPDKVDENQKEKAEEIFVRVSEAYAILSDEDKRKVYDKHGKQGLEMMERGMDPDATGFGGGASGFYGGGFGTGQQAGARFKVKFGGGDTQDFHFDPFEMFKEAFGSGGGGGFGGFDGGNIKVEFGSGSARSNRNMQQKKKTKAPKDPFPKSSANITKMGSPKFPNEDSRYLWLVVFYDYNNPAHLALKAPIYKLASKVKGSYKVGALNCGRNKKEVGFCQGLGLAMEELPAYGFVAGGDVTLFDDKGPGAVPNAKELHEFAIRSMPTDRIQNINSKEQIEERLITPLTANETHEAAILLLSDKYETSGLYASLANEHRNAFIFGESRAKNLNLAKEFAVKRYPLLLALVPAGQGDKRYSETADIVQYRNHVDHENINKWLTRLHRMQAVHNYQRRQKGKVSHDNDEL